MTVRKITPQKNGCKYIFDVYVEKDGDRKRYRSKAYKTIRERKQAEREYYKGLDGHTFNDIIDLYITTTGKRWKKSTRETNERRLSHIRKLYGDKTPSGLTEGDLRGFYDYLDKLVKVDKNGLRRPYSAYYKNQVITYFKAVCNYAELYLNEKSMIPKMIQYYPKPRQQKMSFWTEEQFKAFISCVDDIEYRCFFTFLYYTGLRRGEALALTFDDVDFNRHTISITKAWNKKDFADISPKTKSSVRTIPICDKAYDCILQMKEHHSGRIFSGDRPLAPVNIDRKKKDAIERSGVPYIRIHDFRHSFVSLMINRGRNISMVSQYVGHASTQTTLDVYAHFFPETLKSVIDSL